MHDDIDAILSVAHAIFAQLIDRIPIVIDRQLIHTIAIDANKVDCLRDFRTVDRYDRDCD